MKRCLTKFQSRLFGRFTKISNAWIGLFKQDLSKNLKEVSRKPASESHLTFQSWHLPLFTWNETLKLGLLIWLKIVNPNSLFWKGKPNKKQRAALLHLFFLLLPRKLIFLPASPPVLNIAYSLASATTSLSRHLFYSSFFNLGTILSAVPEFSFPKILWEPFKREYAFPSWRMQ